MLDFIIVIGRKKKEFLALEVHFLLILPPKGKYGHLDTQVRVTVPNFLRHP